MNKVSLNMLAMALLGGIAAGAGKQTQSGKLTPPNYTMPDTLPYGALTTDAMRLFRFATDGQVLAIATEHEGIPGIRLEYHKSGIDPLAFMVGFENTEQRDAVFWNLAPPTLAWYLNDALNSLASQVLDTPQIIIVGG